MAAYRWCSVLRSVCRGGVSVPEIRSTCQFTKFAVAQEPCYQSAFTSVTIQQTRMSSSFFGRLTANELWKGVLAETGGGTRRGRGKRTKKRIKRNLNVGQYIGDGKSGHLWPGLNTPIIASGKTQAIAKRDQQQLEEMQARIFQERDNFEKKRKTRVKRERGWTGQSWGGISIGNPDPGPNGETYEDFDCRVIEMKSVFNMTAKEGRKRSVSALVAVGNGNGAAVVMAKVNMRLCAACIPTQVQLNFCVFTSGSQPGRSHLGTVQVENCLSPRHGLRRGTERQTGFALGKASDRLIALRKAKNRAVQYLHYIERYNDHTIYHDISSTFKRTTIKMKKQNHGYGLHCHRAVITICKLIGIQDMYAKVSGSCNMLNLTRALFLGLAQQETHQDLANKKGLHVVEFRDECGPLPHIVASPQGALSTVPEPEGEIPDTKLDWEEVKVTQGLKRSIWANVKRTIW